MKPLNLLFLTRIIFIFVCFIFIGIKVNGQDTDLDRYQRITPVTRKKLSSAPRTRNIIIQYIKDPKTIIKKVQPTNLSVTTEPNAEITIESLTSKRKNPLSLKANAEGAVIFEDIAAGGYKIFSSLKGFKSEKYETTINPNKTGIIHIPLKRLTYDFPIKTNVDKGEVRYAPLKIDGQNPDGTPKYIPAGGYCVVPIENKETVIKNLSEGDYILDVSSPDSPEYDAKYVRIQVTEELLAESENDEKSENPPTEIILPNRQSTETFSLSPIRADWILSTENWKIDEKGFLKINGVGMALPKASNFRFYKDFEMQSTVRLLNDTSIGFVVRAENENYYLIQLTGSQAENPYLVTASIVKDGKVTERILSNPIKFLLEDVLSNHKQFEVVIKARGNKFQIFAENGTGELKELGNAVFKDNNFPIGAVGIIGGDKSAFEVGRFTVCNEICK